MKSARVRSGSTSPLSEAAQLANTVVLCISADLPFAQARFCGAEGLDNVINLSTMRGADFLKNYGVAIAGGPLAGVAARAVVVLDENDKVLHTTPGPRRPPRNRPSPMARMQTGKERRPASPLADGIRATHHGPFCKQLVT